MGKRETFFRIISPEHLYFAAVIFAVATLLLVVTIYFFLYTKKKNFLLRNKILETLNEWIGEMMVEKTVPEIQLSDELARFLRKEDNRKFIIENLINIKKNLTGVSTETTVYVYEKLNLRTDSVRRFQGSKWYNKAQGIYELYMMNQREYHDAIFKFTNSDNEYVRMEAQTAIIGFSGFDGLVFLDNLTYPLHEWQQIKLLEQLAAINAGDMPHLPLWLQSSNDYVVQFALKLADVYQQFHVHDIVLKSLESNNEKIRNQAIKTMGRVAEETTANHLRQRYDQETQENKIEIIRQLAVVGTGDDLPFLTDRLKEEDEKLAIEAGRAIMTNSRQNWKILEENLSSESIYKQIKQEFA